MADCLVAAGEEGVGLYNGVTPVHGGILNSKISSIIVSREKKVTDFSLLILNSAEELCPLDPPKFALCSVKWIENELY